MSAARVPFKGAPLNIGLVEHIGFHLLNSARASGCDHLRGESDAKISCSTGVELDYTKRE